jgi:type IV pilus assembly protein PilM
MVSLTHFSAEKVADVGEWFNGLDTEVLDLMSPEDRESPPSGEGYIFTVYGAHWHNPEGARATDRALSYLQKTFLTNLQSMTVQQPGHPMRDVRRMGISHATLINRVLQPMEYDPITGIRPVAGGARGGARPGGLPGAQPGGIGGFGGRGANPPTRRPQPTTEGAMIIEEFQFQVEFIYQPVPLDERVDLSTLAADTETDTEADDESAPADETEQP